jgi:hypothetical protein
MHIIAVDLGDPIDIEGALLQPKLQLDREQWLLSRNRMNPRLCHPG